MPSHRLDWLDTKHPIWSANVDRWEQNERRYRGGDYVKGELRPFIWETLPGDVITTDTIDAKAGEHYLARQQQAVYVNFPEMFVLGMKGHLQRNRPLPGAGLNFGSLGEVRREQDRNSPTPAEMIYYNTDGVGVDGSQWDNYWMSVWGRASATGHRWMFAEAPAERAGNRARELAGYRPYMVEFSPQQVTNWHFVAGSLMFAVVRVSMRNPTVRGGSLEMNDGDGYLLLVRNGFKNLGPDFQAGGWWLFDSEKNEVSKGDWQKTLGDIPMYPFFYERDTGVSSQSNEKRNNLSAGAVQNVVENARRSRRGETQNMPAMSRPGITELGQAAVSYMNMASAQEYDAWDAASSITFLLGVDREGWNLAQSLWRDGSQIVPVPAAANGQRPDVADGSKGAVAAGVFDMLLKRKYEEAHKLAVLEATSTPDASGVSKQAGFGELKAPRLANVASEIEQAQNIAIYFLELRWGRGAPSGSVIWPREFDVVDVLQDIQDFFAIEKESGLRSPTLDAKLMVTAATEMGVIVDDEESATIKAEYEESAKAAQVAATAMATLASDFGAGDETPPARKTVTPTRGADGRIANLDITTT